VFCTCVNIECEVFAVEHKYVSAFRLVWYLVISWNALGNKFRPNR